MIDVRLAFIICVVICSVGFLSLVILFALRVCQPGCFLLGSPWDVDEVPVMPATVLVNRVNDDDPHTLASVIATTHTNHPAAARRERRPEQLGMREHSGVAALYDSYSNPYAARAAAAHPPSTSEAEHGAQHDGGDALPEVHSATSHYSRHQHNSPPRSHRSTSTRTTGSERSFRPHHSSNRGQGHGLYDSIEGSSDAGTPSGPRQADSASMLPSHSRSRGRGARYPIARDVRPLAFSSANPLTSRALMRNNSNSVVRLASAAPRYYAHDERSFVSPIPRGSAEDAQGSRRSRLWQWRRRNDMARETCPQNIQGARAVVDGYCCDMYGNRVRGEDAENVYGRAQYISRGLGTTSGAAAPSKESEADDASFSLFCEVEPRSSGHDPST
ncbi:hypothetical protein LSCM4_03288 [Leishmania orientalis]|uniref:Uncharacterized protein n=1 Tax=Leishmania orientalis TaxID=2249476 RepID=A0A836GBA6_9TRYP|nr:hypothetical protein LSCM4_03288 [Leishmania orientalis]